MKSTKEIPVFLSSDNNYVPYMAALMVSIICNTQSVVKFYVLNGGISKKNINRICSLGKKFDFAVEFIDIVKYRKFFPLPTSPSGHVTRASSDRFLIPLIADGIDKLIILDADMIALGDIKNLYDIDISNDILAAVPCFAWTSKFDIDNLNRETKIPESHIYFNMGTMLVNCINWKKHNILDKISSTSVDFDTKKFFFWDEIILNKALSPNKYKIIDPKFNMMLSHQCYYKYGKPDIHRYVIEDYCRLSPDYKLDQIILSHFGIKPWDTNEYYYEPVDKWVKIPNLDEFWYYMKMTPFYKSEIIKYNIKILKAHLPYVRKIYLFLKLNYVKAFILKIYRRMKKNFSFI